VTFSAGLCASVLTPRGVVCCCARYGIGNWSEISEHVGTTKSPEICRDHYFTVYIQSATSPEPVRDHSSQTPVPPRTCVLLSLLMRPRYTGHMRCAALQDTTKTLTTDLKEYLRTRLGRHQSPSFAEPEPPASSALCT
jgi:hypothetical protein